MFDYLTDKDLKIWVCKMIASLENIECMLVNSDAKKSIKRKVHAFKLYFERLITMKTLKEVKKLKKIKNMKKDDE